MDKIIYYVALLANVALLGFALYTFATGYGSDRFAALLLAVPAVFSLWALKLGPDCEERKLARDLNKARMKKELQDLGK